MGRTKEFRQHFLPMVAWTLLLGDSFSQDYAWGWGMVDLGKNMIELGKKTSLYGNAKICR